VTRPFPTDGALPPPPSAPLRGRLIAFVDALAQNGEDARAAELREVLDRWWEEQRRWEERLGQLLGVHHEINNALVGVRGNTQLIMLSDAAQNPSVRERLEVVIRESGRIRDAASRLRELKAALHGPGSSSRAA
jgi:signal transduction histidine kinase